MALPVKFEGVENKIIHLREIPVIIDSDLAQLYGVATREINQAVKNNPHKFPEGYIFELTPEEWKSVKSKFLTSHLGGGKVKIPKVFTEKGLYMLATIIKGEEATETTLAIVETFARIKHLTRNIKALSNVKDEKQKQNLLQKSGELIAEILEDDLKASESETSIELNFAVLKFKHTIKKKKQKP